MSWSKHSNFTKPAWQRKALDTAVAAALSTLAVAPAFAVPGLPPACSASLSGASAACSLSGTSGLAVTGTGTVPSVTVAGTATGATITNAGTIGDGTAINAINVQAGATNTTITNQAGGVITGTGYSNGSVPGTVRFAGSLDGSLTNNGTIASSYTSVAKDDVAGIHILGSLTGTLNNGGTISASATGHGGNFASASAYGVTIQGGLSGAFTNSGTITASASNNLAGAYPYAAGVNIVGALSGNFTNSGTITAAATAVNPAYATGVAISGGIGSGSFTNSGTIRATTTGHVNSYLSSAIGVYLGSGIGIHGTFTNSGTISANSIGGGIAIGVDTSFISGAMNGTLNNSGIISGTALNPAYGYSLVLFGGSGTINNLANGTLSGNLYVGGTVAVNNAGTIAIPAQANGAPTVSLGALSFGGAASIAGNYTQTGNGMLSIGVASPTVYGKLVVGGTADFTGSNKLYVNVSNGASLVAGRTVLSSVVSAGTLTGTSFSVTDNSSMYNFVAVRNGNAIDLDVVAGTSPVTSVAATGSTSAAGAAQVLEGLISNSTGDMTTVMTALGTLSTDQQVSDAIKQTLPLMTGGMAQAALAAQHNTNNAIQGRLDANRGLSSGDRFLGDERVWLKPFGSWADQGDRNGISGYKSRSAGFALGADGEYTTDTRLGAAFAYSSTRVNSNAAVGQSAGVDAYQVAFYGSHALDAERNLDFQADIGTNRNNGHRTIDFGGLDRRADSRYNSLTAHLGAGIGQTMALNANDVLTPSVRVDYTRVRDPGYTETGAGGLNLAVGAETTEELVFAGDAKISHALEKDKTLVANLGLGYDALAKRNSITAAYVGGGAAFTTTGMDPKPWLLRGGIGLVVHGKDRLEVTARYDIEARQGFTNQTASLNLRMPF